MDDFAKSMFSALGYDMNVSQKTLESVYSDFKSKKDKIQPGRLTAEGYAMVSTLAGILEPKKPAKKPTADIAPAADASLSDAPGTLPNWS